MQDATDIRMKSLTARRVWCADLADRSLWLAAAVSVLAVCAVHAATPTGETVVRIYPSAVVSTERVVLSDIAEITGESAQLIADCPIGAAPAPGGSRRIELGYVQELLSRRGVNLARWIFRGATRCTVSRPASIAPAVNAVQPNKSTSQDRSANVDTLPDATDTTINPNSLEAKLRAHLSQQIKHLGGSPQMQFNPAIQKLLALTQPTYRFNIVNRNDRLLGLVSMEVTIFERDTVKQVLPVLAQVSLRKRVVVAARPINRSQTIEPDDLTLVEQVFDRIDAIGMTDSARLIGQRAKRFIKNGDLVLARDIEPVPLITRGRSVTVWVRRGGVVIKGAATAMESASFGENVLLRHAGSRQTFRATVTGRDQAEIQTPNSDPIQTVALGKETH